MYGHVAARRGDAGTRMSMSGLRTGARTAEMQSEYGRCLYQDGAWGLLKGQIFSMTSQTPGEKGAACLEGPPRARSRGSEAAGIGPPQGRRGTSRRTPSASSDRGRPMTRVLPWMLCPFCTLWLTLHVYDSPAGKYTRCK